MEPSSQDQAQPQAAHAERVDPVVPTDVATQPHPVGGDESAAGAGVNQLQNVLPDIKDVAQKVGGYKQLAEIADTLDQLGK